MSRRRRNRFVASRASVSAVESEYPPCVDESQPHRQHFPTLEAMVREATSRGTWRTARPSHHRSEAAYSTFCGGTWDEARDLATLGWPEGASEASELATRIANRAVSAAGTALSMDLAPDVAGACYDVGAYMAGVPECWYRPEPSLAKRAIHIGVNIGASSYVTAEILRRRGIATAALALALVSKGHPVTITVGTVHEYGPDNHSEYISITVADASTGSQLDVDRIVFAMAHPTMLRRFDRAISGGNRWNSSRAKTDEHPTSDAYDLFIGGTHLDQADRWQDGGEAWVLAEFERQTKS